MVSVQPSPLPESFARQQQIVRALGQSESVVAPAKTTAAPESERVFIPRGEPSEGFAGLNLPARQEELIIRLDAWEFKLRTSFVSENEFTFSFGFDEKVLSISPKFEAACTITFRGNTFPAIFGGGNIKFPGLPFTILSFFKDNREQSS